jgi:hypothetical protein
MEWCAFYRQSSLKYNMNALTAVLKNDGERMLELVLKELGLTSSKDLEHAEQKGVRRIHGIDRGLVHPGVRGVAGMRRWAARIDENQPAIVKALRAIGASVTPLHAVGGGVSDLLVSFRQRWYVLEVKNPAKPKSDQELTPDQRKWIGEQRAPVYTVRDALEAINFLQAVTP